jgi:hypothetical protein
MPLPKVKQEGMDDGCSFLVHIKDYEEGATGRRPFLKQNGKAPSLVILSLLEMKTQ